MFKTGVNSSRKTIIILNIHQSILNLFENIFLFLQYYSVILMIKSYQKQEFHKNPKFLKKKKP